MNINLEDQLLNAARIIEEQVDNEIQTLEKLDDDELDKLRQQRFDAMKKAQKEKIDWINNGHGKFSEIADEKQFFEETKKSANVVCHFYRDSTFRCQIVDKHLSLIAPKHLECKFIKLNVEKAPFLTERLKIRVIPTIMLVKNEKTKDFIIGFDDLGGHDEFSTRMMEWRIAQADVINYNGDLLTPPDMKAKKGILGATRKKAIRGNGDDESSDDNDW